ncbi:MAG: diguanylate cyclase [Phycisphaerae bacterium]|nr:MAG: diguanylate cyclase [Phycisphaerae bacterium]MCK6465733.1 diguanylate cyclase [Phycisphaerae bacterium]MCQ3921499.1 hypothetical protein [Planctomycetota bacterium]NUQ08978.1 diguanylate cyclase [Phycisphaerae bacterium]
MRDSAVDLCLIEDDPAQRHLAIRAIEGSGYRHIEAEDASSGFELIKAEHPKVVLCDYLLPGDTGMSLCSRVRSDAAVADTYFILMTAITDRNVQRQAWDCGVDDFLTKPIASDELLARVRVGLRMWTLQDRLRAAAITDGLTRVFNHDHFNRLLDREMSRARRYGRPLALIVLDIDFFKAVNDTFGHLAGNDVLEEVARILRDNARDTDAVGRIGGEEFALLLPESSAADARRVAERIQSALASGLNVPALGAHAVTASFGVADTDDPRVSTAAELVDLADRAMYGAKRRGRNQVICAADGADDEAHPESADATQIDMLRKRIAILNAFARDVYGQSISCLAQAVIEKDPYTARHCVNVAFYAAEVARQLGCASATVKSIGNAAMLHDVGKVGIPDRILMKRGPLTPLEQTIIAQVPHISTRIVENLRILEAEIAIIRHQREYFDGSGAPSALKGDQIPIGARVLLVADAFDAMTTDRVYRQRRGVDAAVAELRAGAGRQFDPRVVLALEQVLARDRAAWQARIDESVDLFQLPSLTVTAPAPT